MSSFKPHKILSYREMSYVPDGIYWIKPPNGEWAEIEIILAGGPYSDGGQDNSFIYNGNIHYMMESDFAKTCQWAILNE